MIQELPLVTASPHWLAEIAQHAAENELPDTLPLPDILNNSLFYPASGFDGNPVRLMAGNVVSFVYADYGVAHGEFLRELNDEGQDRKFLGYTMVAGRGVSPESLSPYGPSYPLRPDPRHDWPNNAFAHWSIWRRDANRDHTHGPQLFSFLYLGWEALTAFRTLYLNKFAPKILAIINPSNDPGIAWTPLRSDCSDCGIFRNTARNSIRNGTQLIPAEYLLCERRHRPPQKPCWKDYDQVCVRDFPDDGLALWKVNAEALRMLPPLPE